MLMATKPRTTETPVRVERGSATDRADPRSLTLMPKNHSVPNDDLVYERADHGLFESAGATYDRNRIYRYRLWRRWAPAMESVVFVMLNPSTATARQLDPTLRRCLGFARSWGFDGFEIVNLFAYRSTSPDVLPLVPDPIGPRNDEAIREAIARHSKVVVAWGVHGVVHDRAEAVLSLLSGCEVECLGRTKDGHPRHPLRLRADTELEPFR